MSPDAVAGDVSDPMSQRAFAYNRSNAVSYTDPTGLYVYAEDVPTWERTRIDASAKVIKAHADKAARANRQRYESTHDKTYLDRATQLETLSHDMTAGTTDLTIHTMNAPNYKYGGYVESGTHGSDMTLNVGNHEDVEESLATEALNAGMQRDNSPYHDGFLLASVHDELRNAAIKIGLEPMDDLEDASTDYFADVYVNVFFGSGSDVLPYHKDR
jgi:hypothetical protein